MGQNAQKVISHSPIVGKKVIYEQGERVFHRDIQTRENNGENTSAQRECFCPIFSSVWIIPSETLARVVYMASQMNRDGTECF